MSNLPLSPQGCFTPNNSSARTCSCLVSCIINYQLSPHLLKNKRRWVLWVSFTVSCSSTRRDCEQFNLCPLSSYHSRGFLISITSFPHVNSFPDRRLVAHTRIPFMKAVTDSWSFLSPFSAFFQFSFMNLRWEAQDCTEFPRICLNPWLYMVKVISVLLLLSL